MLHEAAESNRKQQNNDYGSEDDSLAPTKNQQKSYQAPCDAPKLHKQMNDVLAKLDASMTNANAAWDGALKAVKELPETTQTSALIGTTRTSRSGMAAPTANVPADASAA